MTQLRRRYRQLGNQDERSPLRVALSSQDGKGMAVTSRVKRELYARFCGRLEVKFLRPTRQLVRRGRNPAFGLFELTSTNQVHQYGRLPAVQVRFQCWLAWFEVADLYPAFGAGVQSCWPRWNSPACPLIRLADC